MNGHGFDLANVAVKLVIVIVLIAVIIKLIPVLFGVVWTIRPGMLILVLIVSVLRGMVKKLLS